MISIFIITGSRTFLLTCSLLFLICLEGLLKKGNNRICLFYSLLELKDYDKSPDQNYNEPKSMIYSSRSFLFIGDIIALVIAFFVSANASEYLMGHSYLDISNAVGKERILSLSIIAAIVLFTFYNRGHYFRRIPWWNQFRFIILTCFIAMIMDGFIHYAIKYQFSRLWLASTWFYAGFFIVIIRQIIKIILDKVFNIWFIDTYIIGAGEDVIDAFYALTFEQYTGYKLKGILTFGADIKFNKSDLPLDCIGDIEIITEKELCRNRLNKKSTYIVILGNDTQTDTNIIINELVERGITYSIAPSIQSSTVYGNTPQFFFGHDFILFNTITQIQAPISKFLKRLMDILISFIGLIFLALFLAILVPFIRSDGGPLLFPNVRIGKNGKKFYCLKVRTMAVDAEERLEQLLQSNPEARSAWDTHRKLSNDPRVTKIGGVLRKLSLDELPQLWNVFKGDMAIVGPRPILPDEKEFFDKRQFRLYCSVRPGITGLWQVTGRNNTSFKKRVELDAWYITNWNIWHDIVILFKTVFIVIKRSGIH